MSRLSLLMLIAASLAGCSVQDTRQMAENIRVRAEGFGARVEAERSDRKLAEGGTAYREAPQEEALKPKDDPAEAEAEAATKEKAPPPPPVYVVVPAN